MEFRQLAYFAEVVKCKSFSAAARKLFLTQPALSKAIKSLSNEVGVPLFYTSGNKTIVTAEGMMLYEQTLKILAEYDKTIHLMERLRAESAGVVRVVTSFRRNPLQQMAKSVVAFSDQHEDIIVDLRVTSSQEAKDILLEGRADIAIINKDLQEKDDRFHTVLLREQNLYLIVRAQDPLACHGTARITDLKNRNILTYPKEFATPQAIEARCQQAGFQPKIRLVSSQPEVLMTGVEQGLGICVMASPATQAERTNLLRSIPILDNQLHFALVALTLQEKPLSNAAERFLDYLLEHKENFNEGMTEKNPPMNNG